MKATILGRQRTTVQLRIPDLHPTRILTLPAMTVKGAKGDEIEVEVRSPIETTSLGYGAVVVQVTP